MQLSLRHYSPQFIRVMTLMNVMWIIIGGCLLAYVIVNTKKYIVRQGRYKEFHISLFYLLATLMLSLRLLQFMLTIAYYHGAGDHHLKHNIYNICILASFCEGIIGLQQLCALVEVELMIKFKQTESNESMERFEIKIELAGIKH